MKFYLAAIALSSALLNCALANASQENIPDDNHKNFYDNPNAINPNSRYAWGWHHRSEIQEVNSPNIDQREVDKKQLTYNCKAFCLIRTQYKAMFLSEAMEELKSFLRIPGYKEYLENELTILMNTVNFTGDKSIYEQAQLASQLYQFLKDFDLKDFNTILQVEVVKKILTPYTVCRYQRIINRQENTIYGTIGRNLGVGEKPQDSIEAGWFIDDGIYYAECLLNMLKEYQATTLRGSSDSSLDTQIRSPQNRDTSISDDSTKSDQFETPSNHSIKESLSDENKDTDTMSEEYDETETTVIELDY